MHIKNLSFTDFDSEYLNWLYLTLDEKRKDLEHNIETAEKMESSMLRSEMLHHFVKRFNMCTQFQTKVDEAQKFVKTREIMQQSN